MNSSVLDSLARWLLGEEGGVVQESEMQVVMVSTGVAVAGVFLVSPIVATLAGVYGVTPARAGALVTAFTAPSIVLVPVAGVLADRIGRRPVLVAGLAIFGLAGAAVALTTTFTAALALRALQGVGYAAINPVGVALLGDLYDGSREATAQGLRVVGIQALNLAAPLLAGVLVLAAWQYPFLCYGLAVVVAGWAWVALPDVTPSGGTTLRDYVVDLGVSLRDPVLSLVLATFLLRFAVSFGFLAYVSVLLSGTDGAALASGGLVALYGAVSLVGSSQAGRLTAARDPFAVLAVGFLVGGVGLALAGLGSSFPVLVAGVAVFAAGYSVTGPVQKSLVTQFAPEEVRAGAVSSAVVVQSVGQTAGPLAMGVALTALPVSATFLGLGTGVSVAGAGAAVAAARVQG